MSPVLRARLLAVILAAPGPAVAGTGPLERVGHCAQLEAAHVLVDTKDHRLSLCEDGREVASYRVALGRARR